MGKRLTPEGSQWLERLADIRQCMEDRPEGQLRPEEVALLQDWHRTCEDPEQRQRLGEIISVLGGSE